MEQAPTPAPPGRRLAIPRGLPFVVGTFLLSRALFTVAVVFATALSLVEKNNPVSFGDVAGRIRWLDVSSFFSDSGWYMAVVEQGYPKTTDYLTQQTTLPLFPLYPMLVRALGGSVFAGVLLSGLAALAGLWLLYRVTSSLGDEDAARRALLAISFFPAAHFLSGFRPEGLFFFLVVAAFCCARERRWAWYAALGMLAGATRNTGFGVGVFALTPYLESRRMPRGWEWIRVITLAVVPGLGLLVFSAYESTLTGDMFAWISAQKAWGRAITYPFAFIVEFIKHPYWVGHYGWDIGPVNVLAVGVLVFGGVVLVMRKRWDLVAYLVLTTLPAISSNTMMAMNRHVLAAFPVFIAVGLGVSARRFQYLLATFAFIYGAVAILIGFGIVAATA